MTRLHGCGSLSREYSFCTTEGCPKGGCQVFMRMTKWQESHFAQPLGCPKGECHDGTNENGKAFGFPVRRVAQQRC